MSEPEFRSPGRLQGLVTRAGAMVDTIRINTLREEEKDGRVWWVKQRRGTSAPVMAVANLFFRLAGTPFCVLHRLEEWQQWEVDCFHLLHGDTHRAFAQGRAVHVERVPGRSLSQHLDAGSATAAMFAAAGREFRRAHDLAAPWFSGPWSHADPHLGNVIYEAASDRARLIDFEVRHSRSLPPAVRHAEDLLALLQDLVGRAEAGSWLPLAEAFLAGYDRPEIARLLRVRLFVPRGAARIWWAVRTTYLPGRELVRRMEALRERLDRVPAGR
jgi:hypothetical protein